VSIANGKVSVNLATVINAVKAQLVSSGFGLAANIPDINATFTIFESPNIGKVQTGYNLLNKMGIWLPIIALILLGLGVYIARSHRKALMWAGITVFVSAGILAIGLALGRTAYLNAVTGDVLPRDVAASIFDTVVRFLRDGIRSTALIGLFVALAAFFVGPSVTATRTRELCRHGVAATRTGVERLGLHLAPVTEWVAPRARLLRIIACVAAFVILFFWPYRTPGVVFWFAVVLLVVMFVIQLLATEPAAAVATTDEAAPVTA
jgi:small-conductance mechanosensitive channel